MYLTYMEKNLCDALRTMLLFSAYYYINFFIKLLTDTIVIQAISLLHAANWSCYRTSIRIHNGRMLTKEKVQK